MKKVCTHQPVENSPAGTQLVTFMPTTWARNRSRKRLKRPQLTEETTNMSPRRLNHAAAQPKPRPPEIAAAEDGGPMVNAAGGRVGGCNLSHGDGDNQREDAAHHPDDADGSTA